MPITISGKALAATLILIIISLSTGSFLGFSYSQLKTENTLDNYTNQINTLNSRISTLENTNNTTQNQLKSLIQENTALKDELDSRAIQVEVLPTTNNDTNGTKVTLETSVGNIVIQLYDDKAPITVANFLSYVKAGFYDGTVFHRVESGFVIQGGGFSVNGTEKTTNSPIKLESNNGLKNVIGTIAMGRTSQADSATSEFYINLVDNSNLDYSSTNPGYAVFGKVISGMDVINQIGKVPTYTRSVTIPGYGPYPFKNWPVNDIVINRCFVSNFDQSTQAPTQVRIDSVSWNKATGSATLDVRNTGSVDAIIEAVTIRVNTAGSTGQVFGGATIGKSVAAGSHIATIGPCTVTGYTASTSYIVRVTTNTGFYYEAVFTSPA